MELSAIILAILNTNDKYGYLLTQEMKKIINLSESALYPVLRQLQKQNLVTSYTQEYNGRNRRYYSITATGRAELQKRIEAWHVYKENIDNILRGQ